jgi:hypothetical protein
MAQATHSPAPWSTGTDEDGHVVYSADLEFVAECGSDDGDAEREAANARLIAAAPDLLAAIKTLLADMEFEYRDDNGDSDHDGMEKARAAIAKAEPQS